MVHDVVFNTNSPNFVFWASIVVDIQTLSVIVASASVVAGIVYYAVQFRHQTRIRQTDLLLRLYTISTNKEWLEAWQRINQVEITDWVNYSKKYGTVDFNIMVNSFNALGLLLQKGLIDTGLIDDMLPNQIPVIWEQMKPAIEGVREQTSNPKLMIAFEYLYNEMKKREQLQQKGVRNG
jgi:hypothetical protein